MVFAIVDNQLVQPVQYGMHIQVQVFIFVLDVVAEQVAVYARPAEVAGWGVGGFRILVGEVGLVGVIGFGSVLREELRVGLFEGGAAHGHIVEQDGCLEGGVGFAQQLVTVCGAKGGERDAAVGFGFYDLIFRVR